MYVVNKTHAQDSKEDKRRHLIWDLPEQEVHMHMLTNGYK